MRQVLSELYLVKDNKLAKTKAFEESANDVSSIFIKTKKYTFMNEKEQKDYTKM